LLTDNPEDGDEVDEDTSTANLELLLTGRGPVVDELSTSSVPAGSLFSSTKDFAVAGPSRVTPSLRLGQPTPSATVTSGTYLEYPAMPTTSDGMVSGIFFLIFKK
jgi:hypothetical protein